MKWGENREVEVLIIRRRHSLSHSQPLALTLASPRIERGVIGDREAEEWMGWWCVEGRYRGG